MGEYQAWRIWERFVGNGASRSDFTVDGKVDEEAIEEQVVYADSQGWLENVDADELREAIRIVCSE